MTPYMTKDEIDWSVVLKGGVVFVKEPFPRIIVECPTCHRGGVPYPPIDIGLSGFNWNSNADLSKNIKIFVQLPPLPALANVDGSIVCKLCKTPFILRNDVATSLRLPSTARAK